MTGDGAGVVSRFASVLTSLDPDDPPADRFCEAGQLMLDADGAAITLHYDQPNRQPWSATSDLAAKIEDAQDVAGEGPGFDAESTGTVVWGRFGFTDSPRWPLLEDTLARHGFTGTVLAIPIAVDDHLSLGVLVAHRLVSELQFDAQVAAFMTHTIGRAIVKELSPAALEAEFASDWAGRAVVNQATGMVVAQLGIHPDDALAMLRGRAYVSDARLVDVALDVVERRSRLDDFPTAD